MSIEPSPPPEDEYDEPKTMPGGGWLSGPSVGGGDIISAAIAALQEFGGGIDGYRAATLLGMWARVSELTSDDRKAVLDYFRDVR